MNGVSKPQRDFIEKLLNEKEVPTDNANDLRQRLALGQVTMADASKAIDWLLQRQRKESKVDAEITAGVYELADGTVYVVKPNKAKTRLYAKRLVEINGDRLTDADTVVSIEFDYEAGGIYKIKASDRMDVARAKELTIRYGRCIVCGRKLKAAVSVERGIGPVCIKSFAVAA